VLPGIIAAVVLSGSTNAFYVVCGALVASLLSITAVRLLTNAGLSSEGALGVTFTTFFALGVLGLNIFGSQIDLDPSCILYGSLELAPLETFPLSAQFGAHFEVPRAAFSSLLTLVAVTIVIVSRRRRLMITSFDSEMLKLSGSSTLNRFDSGLFFAVAAAAVVNSFFAIGAVATTGILITPAVIARLFSNSMRGMWIITIISTTGIACCGYLLAVVFDTPVAGAVSGLAFLLALLAVFLSPHGGVLPRLIRGKLLILKIATDHVLANKLDDEKQLTNLNSRNPRSSNGFFMLTWLRISGLMAQDGTLTEPGLRRAQTLVRSHRVWESYLVNELKFAPDHVHEPSDRMEHFLTPDLTEKIADQASLSEKTTLGKKS